MRTIRATLCGLSISAVFVAPTITPVWAAPHEVSPEVHNVTLVLPEQPSGDGTPEARPEGAGPESPQLQAHEAPSDVGEAGFVVSAQLQTEDFAMVGAVLPESGVKPQDVQVRARTAAGAWSGWQPLEDGDGGPDADSAEAEQAVKNVTAPLWVGDADAIQTRVSSRAAASVGSLDLSLVDPGRSRADGLPAQPAATADSAAARPRIITRAQWGADERLTCSDTSAHKRAFAAVVHHTAGSNGYRSVAEAMRQIRGDYAYHTKTRGWCDIGYNFVVDKWGNVYEGRRGSMTSARIGAHAAGFNTGTVGVSMLGNHSSVHPSTATQNAVASVIAWRLSTYDADPATRVNYIPGAGSPKLPRGRVVSVPRVMGHRDVALTTCPGNAGYRTLGRVRSRAQAGVNAAPYIRAVYRDTLRREASDASVRYWNAAALRSKAAVIGGIGSHVDSRRRVVASAYQVVLNRSASRAEQDHWAEQLRTGRVNDRSLIGQLAGSREFYSQAGRSNGGYVKLLFRRVLQREARSNDVRTWGAATARRGRVSVANAVYGSTEGAHRRIDRGYQTYLGRKPDRGALRSRAAAVRAKGDEALRVSLMLSAEYAARANQRY